MSVIASEVPDARVLDLFAGSGALGLEALSRGAASVTFVENAPGAMRTLRRNIEALAPPRDSVRVVRADALRYAASLEPSEFDLAFADPPYGQGLAQRLVEIYETNPFASHLAVEHARDEILTSRLPRREKRYGDTMLTFFEPDVP